MKDSAKKNSGSGPVIDTQAMKNIVDFLLDKINPRAKEVLTMRFGLSGEKPKSLSFIGSKIGITRERVRQIEVDSFKRIKKTGKPDGYKTIIDRAIEVIDFYGGFCEKRMLKEKVKPDITDGERSLLMIILNASKRIKFQKSNKQLEAYWYLEGKAGQKMIADYSAKIFTFIESRKSPVKFDEISAFASDLDGNFFTGKAGERKLKMLLCLNRNLQRNILEEWGSKKWNLISGKGSRERAYLVLKKYNEPLHFRTLADKINENFTDKKTLAQTVHNELIKDGRFVQVGKGTYGLLEWGLVQGTVKDVIMKLLKEKERVLKEEVIDYVMSQKKVKRTTIAVNLADQKMFGRDENGNYFLIG